MKRASQPGRTRVIGLLALAWLTSLMFAQTTDKTPAKGNASIQIAMDEARDALKHYQTALASVRGLPEIGPTVREDLQVVLASRNTVDWLRGKSGPGCQIAFRTTLRTPTTMPAKTEVIRTQPAGARSNGPPTGAVI